MLRIKQIQYFKHDGKKCCYCHDVMALWYCYTLPAFSALVLFSDTCIMGGPAWRTDLPLFNHYRYLSISLTPLTNHSIKLLYLLLCKYFVVHIPPVFVMYRMYAELMWSEITRAISSTMQSRAVQAAVLEHCSVYNKQIIRSVRDVTQTRFHVSVPVTYFAVR